MKNKPKFYLYVEDTILWCFIDQMAKNQFVMKAVICSICG